MEIRRNYRLRIRLKNNSLGINLFEGITLQDYAALKPMIISTESVLIHFRDDGYSANKTITFELGSNIKNEQEIATALALLQRVAANPLLLYNANPLTSSKSEKISSIPYFSLSHRDARPDTDIECNSPIALIPFIIRNTRFGIGIGIGCCQTIKALLHQNTSGIIVQDLLTAIIGVLIMITQRVREKWRERDFTSSFVYRELSKNYHDRIDEVLSRCICALFNNQFNSLTKLTNYLKRKWKPIFSILFGRTTKTPPPESNNNLAILVLTEQMNLADILPFSTYRKLRILYSPLTMVNRLLLEPLINEYCKRIKHEYHFCSVSVPILLEYHLRESFAKSSGQVDVLPGGGTAAYLTCMKVAKKYSNANLTIM